MWVKATKLGYYDNELRAPAKDAGYRGAGKAFKLKDPAKDFTHEWMVFDERHPGNKGVAPPPPPAHKVTPVRSTEIPGLKPVNTTPATVGGVPVGQGEETDGEDQSANEPAKSGKGTETPPTANSAEKVEQPEAGANVAKPSKASKPAKSGKGTGSREVI